MCTSNKWTVWGTVSNILGFWRVEIRGCFTGDLQERKYCIGYWLSKYWPALSNAGVEASRDSSDFVTVGLQCSRLWCWNLYWLPLNIHTSQHCYISLFLHVFLRGLASGTRLAYGRFSGPAFLTLPKIYFAYCLACHRTGVPERFSHKILELTHSFARIWLWGEPPRHA